MIPCLAKCGCQVRVPYCVHFCVLMCALLFTLYRVHWGAVFRDNRHTVEIKWRLLLPNLRLIQHGRLMYDQSTSAALAQNEDSQC